MAIKNIHARSKNVTWSDYNSILSSRSHHDHIQKKFTEHRNLAARTKNLVFSTTAQEKPKAFDTPRYLSGLSKNNCNRLRGSHWPWWCHQLDLSAISQGIGTPLRGLLEPPSGSATPADSGWKIRSERNKKGKKFEWIQESWVRPVMELWKSMMLAISKVKRTKRKNVNMS